MAATVAQLRAAAERMSAEEKRESKEHLLGSLTELEARIKAQGDFGRLVPPAFDRSLVSKAGLGALDASLASKALASLDVGLPAAKFERVLEQTLTADRAFERLTALNPSAEALMGFDRLTARLTESQRITTRLLDYKRLTRGIVGGDYFAKALDAALNDWWDRSSARLDAAITEFARPRYLDALVCGIWPEGAHRFADAVEDTLAKEPAVKAFSASDLAEVERQRARVANGPLLDLMDAIIRDPRIRYEADWRALEKIVAEIYKAQGCSHVQLGNGSKDGGVDVVATMPTSIGDMVIGAQVKRRSKKNTVKPEVLHAFYTVITHRGYNQGVLFTTTTVQPAAKAFMSEKNTFMRAVEGEELVEMIRWLRSVI